ncbi:hypothetical protein B5G18_13535 [Clostridium perfringens]|uniref:LytR/AlgR family response regulator transcription factor n=1 Tax=Clostridium perfringens TaxID=1502 RepID=UPI000B36DB31|nr:response regulator transcription factor [Clostridium perfringens]OUN51186.1 hypothetical protein B5G18_13535 [Clostridium perfringens]OUP43972.1 hypothetical protein B5F20_12830 [Clostridium perfringens]
MSINIAICDQNINFTSLLEKKLYEISKKNLISIDVEVFFNGKSLINNIKESNKYNAIYIYLPTDNNNGINICKEIRRFSKDTLLFLVSDKECYLTEALELQAFRFVNKKTLDIKILEKYFLDMIETLEKSPNYFNYRYNKNLYRVPLNDIIFFQSYKRIIQIVTKNGVKSCYEKLGAIEKKLNKDKPRFYRVHQSFLVNPNFIAKYNAKTIELLDGNIIPVSDSKRKQLKEFNNKNI